MLTSQQLHGQVDTQLRSRADTLRLAPYTPAAYSRRRLLDLLKRQGGAAPPSSAGNQLRNLQARPNQVRGYQQLIDSSGRVLFRSASVTLPVDERTRLLAAGAGADFFQDASVNGIHLRILAGTSRRAARSRWPSRSPKWTTCSGACACCSRSWRWAASRRRALGRLVAGAAVKPLRRLTQATEHVSAHARSERAHRARRRR